MKTTLFLAALILGALAVEDFVLKIPKDVQGKSYGTALCHWEGFTTWYGYCPLHACPPETFWTKYEEVVKSHGWEYTAMSIVEFFDRKFGNVTVEDDVHYKAAHSIWQNFGAPCFTGGRKTMCCKAGFTGALSAMFNKK